jgi:hypothetical protein
MVVVNTGGIFLDVIGYGIIEEAGSVDGRAVGEVPAVGEVEAEDSVTGVNAGKKDGGVGLCAGMGLHIDPVCAEEDFEATDGQLFNEVNFLTAAVVTSSGVSFGVLVGEDGPHGVEDVVGDVIFGSDKLYAA